MLLCNDIIMKLLQIPFSRHSKNNKREILNNGRLVIALDNLNIKYSNTKVYSRSFKEFWYDFYK
jgi:hypothetical protein